MNKAILLGDPHLGKALSIGKAGIGANLNSRIVDQMNLFDWTLEQAIENNADTIIITGDVFEDPKPHPALITLFISWLKKCQAYNVHVHIIIGNHDVLRSGFIYNSPLDIITEVELDNVSVYKDINTIIIGTTAFTLLPFRDRKSFGVSSGAEAISLMKDSLIYELASIPNTYNKVLIGHLAIEGSIPIGDEIDDLTNELFCPLNMFDNYHYVWMGHVHKPQVMKKSSPYIAHIGSMDISNFGETDHTKHIIIINADAPIGEKLWETKALPTRQLKKLSVTIPKDTENTTEFVLNELKKIDDFDKSIVRVEVALSSSDLKSIDKSIIEKYLLEKGVFNINGISESKKLNVVKKDNNNSIDTKMDVSSAIKIFSDKYVEKDKQDLFIELAMDIYNLYKADIEVKE